MAFRKEEIILKQLGIWISCLLLTLLAFLPAQSAAAAARARQDYAPVLMYHDIKVKPLNGFDVTRDDFRKQLDWLQAHHYQTLSMEEYLAILEQGRPFPEKSILITFDDGYEGVYTQAVPELIQHSMKATFFIFKNGLDTKLVGYPYLTTQEVKEMAANPLFSIESHTISHPDLTALTPEQVQQELTESRSYLEKLTGQPCRALAYPYGRSNPAVLAAVTAAGYQAAFSIVCADPAGFDTCYTIPRIYMGMELGKNHNALFKQYVTEYASMPPAAFAERFGDLAADK